MPLILGENSEPEPDIAVVTGSARDYRDAHPSTAVLIVEVGLTPVCRSIGSRRKPCTRAIAFPSIGS